VTSLLEIQDRPAGSPLGRTLYHPFTGWAIVIVGIGLRLRRYLQDRGLLHDDAQLASNIFARNFAQLLRPLDIGNQAAPVGFLILQKCAACVFGHGELAIRLIPFLASALVLPLFFCTIRKTAGQTTALAATAWLALAEPLVRYSAEGKQYSTDVLWTTVILALAASAERIAAILVLAIAGDILLWFSHPLLFVLGGIGLTRIIRHWRQRKYGLARADAAVGVSWLASFAANYLLISRYYVTNDYLRSYWQELDAFAPVHATLSAFLWYPRTIAGLFNYPLGIVPDYSSHGPLFVFACRFIFYAAVVAFVFGCFVMATRSKRVLAYTMFTLLLAMAASALHRYPFSERLTLFCAPLVVLPFGYAVGPDRWRRSLLSAWARVFVCAVLFVYPVYLQAKYFIHPEVLYDVKPAINYVKAHWREGDSLYLHYGSDVLGNYYLNAYPVLIIPRENLIHGVDPFSGDIPEIEGRNRVWVVFSMGAAKDQPKLEQILAVRGRLLDHRQFNGGAADLYDLR
jgi:hypothetical protein